MTEWKTYRLGDVISIKSGFAYKGEYLGKGDKYLLGMGCVSFNEKFLPSGARLYSGDVPSRYFVKAGDIVLATRQQSDNLPILGMPAIIPSTYKNTFVGANLYAVQNDSDIDNNYLYWLLKTPEYIQHIKSCQTGTTVRMITKSNIESFEFKCPNRTERNRISNFLWSLENKIENNRRINTNLELQAQALFDKWCESCSKTITIKELADNILDYTPNANSEVVLLNSSDVTQGVFAKLPLVSNVNLKGQFKKRFQKGDILYSEIRPRNTHYAYCYFDSDRYIASTRLIVLRGKKEKIVSNTLLYQYLISQNVFEEFTLKTETRSGTFPQGNYQDLSSIVVPYSDNQREIAGVLDSIYKRIWHNNTEIETLATLRDTLLPKLMNGEIQL